MAGAAAICVGWEVGAIAGCVKRTLKVGAGSIPGSDGSGAECSGDEPTPQAMDAQININTAAEINILRNE
jgi:hypothetical protein